MGRTMNDTEIAALRKEVERLNAHRFVAILNHPWKGIGFQFLRGIAFGLGSVIGATLVVSALGFALSTVNFVPILGDWANEIAKQIEVVR
jgi:hypothetical protein